MAKKADLNGHPKLPFPVGDRAAYIRKATVAMELVQVPTLRVVTYNLAYNRVEVIDIPVSRISTDVNTRDQYYVDGYHTMGGPASTAKTQLSWLRIQALKGGATPDAIRLLSKATGAFTKKEENEMAEKLKAAKSANKAGLKAAAKSAPVAAKGNARKGNAEALAKARAAKDTGPDNRKITVVKKDHGARAGSARADMLNTIYKSKTVQAAVDSGVKKSDVSWAQRAGYITIK
jgi:hypothetical protein